MIGHLDGVFSDVIVESPYYVWLDESSSKEEQLDLFPLSQPFGEFYELYI